MILLRYGLFAALLLGCASPAERAARAQAEMEEMIAVYGPACEKLGFKKDTEQWRDCILRMVSHDDSRYRPRPTTTTCIGQQGLYSCTTY